MIGSIVKKVMGSRNQRVLRGMSGAVRRINAREPEYRELTDEALKARTEEFRQRHLAGEPLDSLLPEAFAAAREASRRALGMRHFDVQLMGAIVLHQGKISEMRTGEGKTLVAVLAAYLNALAGKGVHIITVNEYLARRDAEWMGPVYNFLGLSVGFILSGQDPEEKRAAYAADITYGTNNEFGFDYLRDNMAFSLDEKVQRELHHGIIDEVDSILIDEARTPLIISGATTDDTELYVKVNKLVPTLRRQQEEDGPGDFSLDEKIKQVFLTEEGHQHVEELFVKHGLLSEGESLYDASNLNLVHHLNAALRAHHLYQKDVDYIVRDGEVVIVDEFTGRIMPGRRWSDGLHQAIEAKEGVKIQSENQTLASITFQNYFRMYDKLSGMTGTADTEAYEFQTIYGLEVVVVPTNKPMIRDDLPDQVYMTSEEKYEAIAAAVTEARAANRPVLVGTASIEVSELLSKLLQQRGIQHEVLNAKQHQREAQIIAQAGRPGVVTIATNMAGRGTDIVLGGNPDEEIKALGQDADPEQARRIRDGWAERHQQVVDAGGLHIVGSERHESRRVDNQLRGRAGRQGDPGSTRFYLSLEDSLLRIFGSGKIGNLMQRLGMERGEAIEHNWVTRAIENAQRKVEAHNFDIRKQLLEYDDVANDQRQVIYEQRNELLESEDVSDTVAMIRDDVLQDLISNYVPPQSLEEQWDVPGLEEALKREFFLELPIRGWLDEEERLNEEALRERIADKLNEQYQEKVRLVGEAVMRHLEKAIMLQVLDDLWREHLAAMDHLRQGIHLRGYAQVDPKQEYKREAFGMFRELLERLKYDTVTMLHKVQVREEEDVAAMEQQRRRPSAMEFRHEALPEAAGAEAPAELALEAAGAGGGGEPLATPETYVRPTRKVGRNEPCPCGSGKKYKHCHGMLK